MWNGEASYAAGTGVRSSQEIEAEKQGEKERR